MGNKIRTIQNIEIIKSDLENNLLFLKGSIPGSKNSSILIKKSVKNVNKISVLENEEKIKSNKNKEKKSKWK